jgi:ribosome-associated protein
MVNSLEAAQLMAEAADEKKAYDILILDLRGLTCLADYFVICSGNNPSQVGAISDQIAQVLAMHRIRTSHIEGQAGATWVLMDYGDVVVHIFDEQARLYYSLEKLWNDAPRVVRRVARRVLQSASS